MTRAIAFAALFFGPQYVNGCPGSASNTPSDTCTVSMKWMQKDAYAEYAGRTSPAWPAHTTMYVSADCRGTTYTSQQANHGTTVGTTDAAGTSILDLVRAETASVPRADALDFIDAFDDCHCDGTTFLSTDSLADPQIQALIADAAGYLDQHMTCSGTSALQIVGLLQAGNGDAALAEFASCQFDPGHDWESAMEWAIQAGGGALYDYHVCNNDAVLQADLWQELRTSGNVGTCSANAAVCHNPMFFYNP